MWLIIINIFIITIIQKHFLLLLLLYISSAHIYSEPHMNCFYNIYQYLIY